MFRDPRMFRKRGGEKPILAYALMTLGGVLTLFGVTNIDHAWENNYDATLAYWCAGVGAALAAGGGLLYRAQLSD